jgi:ABC-type dipeptide/oligopeptide/nickel transport system permease subunit
MTTFIQSNTTISLGLWQLAWRRLRADRVAMISLAVVAVFLLSLFLSAIGIIAKHWDAEIAVSYAPPSWLGADENLAAISGSAESIARPENPVDPLKDILRALQSSSSATTADAKKLDSLLFGADKWGHDILQKTIKGAETSIIVGLIAALLATFLGTVFGAVSGYYGKWIDDFFNWFYNVFTSIPYMLLILSVAAVLQKKGVLSIVLILGLTGWTSVYRQVRAEYIKHKAREYVMAADAIGASHWQKMFVHIFPNLGFGVPVGTVSWGSMLSEAQNELILGKWWQLAAASMAMAILVTAFSLFTDALRDALDPKLTSKN